MSFARREYRFFSEIDLSVVNPGSYVNGVWKEGCSWAAASLNPADNETIAWVRESSLEDYEEGIQACRKAAKLWMKTPVRKRCEIVRQIGDALRAKIHLLGRLVSLEVGKILLEGIREVQEVIDMCDYAGTFLNSTVWNPLGVVGVITPFNFPCAVLGRNACLALVTGNCVVWKGSRTTPLVTIAMTKLVAGVLKSNNLPGAIFTSFCGSPQIGQAIAEDKRIPLVSFTGTSKVGLMVQQRVNDRFGKCLLELSGNNAITVMDDADILLAVDSVMINAVGTAGQCRTTCRRLLLHESIYEEVLDRLLHEYRCVAIGDPLNTGTLLGPLRTRDLQRNFQQVIHRIKSQGGKILVGGSVPKWRGNFVRPTIVEISPNANVVKEELFAPVLYVFKFQTFQEAIKINNSISQGSSNSIFTRKPKVIYEWIRSLGSDCGIDHVIGVATIGFWGGRKATRGLRAARSDSWEQYVRRTTCTINYGYESLF